LFVATAASDIKVISLFIGRLGILADFLMSYLNGILLQDERRRKAILYQKSAKIGNDFCRIKTIFHNFYVMFFNNFVTIHNAVIPIRII